MRTIKTETKQHEEAFRIWCRLLNYTKTAQVMGVHEDTVASWGKNFDWRVRYAKEIASKTDGEIQVVVGDIRRSAVYVTDLIQGWIVRLANICDDSIRAGRPLTDEEEKTIGLLTVAIGRFNPSLMRNLFAYMKANLEFQVGTTGGGQDGDAGRGMFNRGVGRIIFKGPTLILVGPKGGDKDGEILQLTGTGNKTRTRLAGLGKGIELWENGGKSRGGGDNDFTGGGDGNGQNAGLGVGVEKEQIGSRGSLDSPWA